MAKSKENKVPFKQKFAELRSSGKHIDPSIPLEEQKNVTFIEYISICLARVGGMFGTTLTGTLAATFLYELYFGPVGVSSGQIASISARQTTITTIIGLAMPLIAGVVVQKWKSRWGRYRQWYIICLIPIFILTVSFYWVPSGWTVRQMTWLRYAIAALQTVFNAFNNLGQNIVQVITPNYKEKKSIATLWQISYYLGYGLAYLSPELFKLFIPKGDARYSERYLILTLIAATLTMVGNLMCGLFCRERIELAKKPKAKLSKSLFTLFKYKNYRSYQYFTWVNVFANLGKYSTLLAGITVGSSNVILLTVPTAAGTVVGNILCGFIAKKHEPTKILRFCGVYSLVASLVLFGICYAEKGLGIYFWQGWTAIFFYIFYFFFGVGVGFQELSTSHFNVEYYDYLEWQTGERLEAVQGIIPGWINSGITYIKDLLIPYILVWIAYPTSDTAGLESIISKKIAEGAFESAESLELIDIIKLRIESGILTENSYLGTCLWLLALLVFTYALTNLLKAIILKFGYDIEGEKKNKMYEELEEMREKRHSENLGEEAENVAAADNG